MSSPRLPVALDGGLVLRTAQPTDATQIFELSIEAHGDQEAWGLRYVFDRYGVDAWTVVVDGDRVVSTCMLLGHELEVGPTDGVSVVVPAAQIEYVATHPDFQRRGLVRAQFDEHHRTADERGDLVVFITGIPYFYRYLGYSYGISYPTVYRIAPDALARHDGWEVRLATIDDLPLVRRLHDRAVASAELRIARAQREWEAMFENDDAAGAKLYVACHDGEARGWMRYAFYARDNAGMLVQAGTSSLAAAEVLVRHTVDLAGGAPLFVLGRSGDPLDALLQSVAFATDDFNAIYTRIVDPIAMLEALRPVLDDRLSRSVLASESGELLISLYTRTIRLSYEAGALGDISWSAGIEEPDGESSIGLPPDAFPPLVLGRFGASGLAERIDDVTLGRPRALADVLFPPLIADVIGVL